jgi:hypothetical protein
MGLNPLEQLNLVTMAAMAAIFLVTFFILRTVLFNPLIDVMEKRAGKLERSRARYQGRGGAYKGNGTVPAERSSPGLQQADTGQDDPHGG